MLVTNPKVLSEFLVQRSYEFIKPRRIQQTIGKILGIGILFAEGNEHKVRRRRLTPFNRICACVLVSN